MTAAAADNRSRLAELLRRKARTRTYPLSADQERLWFLDQFTSGTPLFNVPLALHLTGPLAVDALRRGLDTIVARHEVLRTTFPARGGVPAQVVAPTATVPLSVEVLDPLPAEQRRRAALGLVSRAACAPFDLAAGPLFRAVLLRIAVNEHILILTLHHIVSDAWSLRRLRDELSLCYTAYVHGDEPTLPPLAVQYGDFARWQRERLVGDLQRRQIDYWAAQLAGAPALLTLPTDRPRPVVQSYRGATQPIAMPRQLAAGLRGLSQTLDATLFMTLLGGFAAVLSRCAGQDDLVIGVGNGQRPHPDLEHLIGCFTNTLALRVRLTGEPTFRELVAQVREVTVDALTNSDVPFTKLVEVLEPERTLAYAPIFQVVLMVHHAPASEPPFAGLAVRPVLLDTGTAKFDLMLVAEDWGEDLTISFEYATDLFDAATVRQLGQCLTTLLSAAVADPDRPVPALPPTVRCGAQLSA